MNYLDTKVNKLLKEEPSIKRWLISNIADKYYKIGYQDGQNLIYKNILKGSALEEFVNLLKDCGIKISYDINKGGLLISIKTDKIPELQKLINCYKNGRKVSNE